MQLRRAELPKNSHRQRLAAPGVAKALRGLFLNLSREENCVAVKRMILAQKATTFRNGKFAIYFFQILSTSRPLYPSWALYEFGNHRPSRNCMRLSDGRRENGAKSVLMLLPSRWCVARELNFSGSA